MSNGGGEGNDDPTHKLNEFRARRTSTVAKEKREWIWEPWIPRKSLGMVAGDPGTGKTTAILDILACLSRGSALPNGYVPPRPIPSLVVALEASMGLDVAPRLEFMGADRDLVHYIPREAGVSFPKHLPDLEREVLATGAQLVVIDPMFKAISSTEDMNKNQQTAQMMMLFEALCQRANCTVLFIHHLNKGIGSRALYKAAGAISIVGSMRFSLAVGPIPDEPPLRALTWFKGNVSAPELCPTLAFEIVPDPRDRYITGVRWDGPRPEVSVNTIFEGLDTIAALHRRRAPPKDRVAIWLDEYFDRAGDLPVDPEALYAAGTEMGFTKDQISTARKVCGITVTRMWPSGRTVWSRSGAPETVH